MARKVGRDSVKHGSSTPNVRVKSATEVANTLHNFITHNVHDRHNLGFSTKTQKQLVAYGPWLAALVVLVFLPELLALAKTGSLISFEGFLDVIFFNQQSWVLLILILINTMLFVNGLTYIFNRRQKGWNRVYLATLLSTAYIVWQLVNGSGQLAGTILSLIGAVFILFTLLDIKKYYR